MNKNSQIVVEEDREADTNQYLTFMLGDEEYGVEILRVHGIQGWDSATPIPNAPDYVLGVTNLRGAIVPIIDLRRRFGMQSKEFDRTTVVIVVKIEGVNQDRIVGMVVDGVSEVYTVDKSGIQAAPDFGGDVDTRFVNGLATMEERMLILLDIDRLIDDSVELDTSAAEPQVSAVDG